VPSTCPQTSARRLDSQLHQLRQASLAFAQIQEHAHQLGQAFAQIEGQVRQLRQAGLALAQIQEQAHQLGQPLAEIQGQVHQLRQAGLALTALAGIGISPAFPSYTRHEALLGEQLTVAASGRPADRVHTRDTSLEAVPSIDGLFLVQLTLRALAATIALAAIIALWEEQKETASAQTMVEIIGLYCLWYFEIDRTIWKKLR
jgi:hypothetical protein